MEVHHEAIENVSSLELMPRARQGVGRGGEGRERENENKIYIPSNVNFQLEDFKLFAISRLKLPSN